MNQALRNKYKVNLIDGIMVLGTALLCYLLLDQYLKVLYLCASMQK